MKTSHPHTPLPLCCVWVGHFLLRGGTDGISNNHWYGVVRESSFTKVVDGSNPTRVRRFQPVS
jgi:hypothetical protein